MKSAIIGTYNSGSSVLSQIVEVLGADIGRPLWGDHFESLTMEILLSAWWNEKEKKFFASVCETDRVPFFKAWGDHYEQSTGLACLKHPLLCLSGSDLDAAWGDDYLAIRAFRPLEESIAGLKDRRWFPGEEERMQQQLFSTSDAYFQDKKHLCVNYADLVDAPREMVEEISTYLGLSCSSNTLESAAACVRPARR